MAVILTAASVLVYLFVMNFLSYRIYKAKILRSRRWGLNICCGKTDGGGINADIIRHTDLPNFVLTEDIYNLPFRDCQFETVLCSHTMEHTDSPDRFYKELKRVGREVVLVLPPLYDLAAVLNFTEHRWIFLSFRKKHSELPGRIRLPGSRWYQRKFGQRFHA